MTLETPVQAISKGSLVTGKYRIIEEIGRGGMGIVYKAEDTKLKRVVALKFLPQQWISDKEARERFIHEARAASALDHNNVCAIHEIEETEDGRMYIAMAFYEGESLREKIKREPLKTEEAVAIAAQVAQGMAKAHQKGIVHRDLKPANILVTNDGVAKIVDFGLAKLAGQVKLTREGATVGTVAYMSPEQARGDAVDQHTDIWSLGVVLYEMLSGKLPFKGDYEQSLIHSILKSELEPITKFRKDLPAGLANIIAKTLVKNTAVRYQTMDELAEDLNAVAEGLKPLRAKPGLFQGRILGLRKTYAFAAFAVFAILVALALFFLFINRGQVYDSIAVLPFEDLSQAKNNEYFCDGISETLISALTNIEGLWVPARTSAFFFKGKTQDIREIGQKLGVDNVLEGSVQVAGDNLRIIARISNVQNGRQVWSEIYNRKMADIFSIQDDIVKAMVTALKIKLLGEKGAPLIKNYTDNFEAYRLYLQGLNYWNKRRKADLIKSIEYFEKAVEIDSNYALAYAGVADAYSVLGNNGFWPAEKAFPKAKAATLKALGIDAKLAEAHASLAYIMSNYDWDFVGAEKEFKVAIELNSSYATAHQWYGELLSILGRHEESIGEMKIARNLDPLSPRISANVGLLLYEARRYDQALEELNKALEVDPNDSTTHTYLGWTYEAMGKYEEAIKSYLRAIELSGGSKDRDAGIAGCFALMGKQEEARKILNNIIEYSKGNYIRSANIASAFAALGEKGQTFAWLDKAFRERDPGLVYNLKNRHRFDPVRSDPRYVALLRKIGLEK